MESPDLEDLSIIPAEYMDFIDVFSKTFSFQLPPHRQCDCAITLLEGVPLPKGHLYPLSLNKEEALDPYIRDGLKQGIIHPSTSQGTMSMYWALEQLHEANVFTKLDLRSTYNLVWIQRGDECKTSFIITNTGSMNIG